MLKNKSECKCDLHSKDLDKSIKLEKLASLSNLRNGGQNTFKISTWANCTSGLQSYTCIKGKMEMKFE